MATATLDRKALTESLAKHRAEAERIAGTFKVDEAGRMSVERDQLAGYRNSVNAAKEIKSILDADQAMGEVSAYLDAPDGTPAAASGLRGTEYKSLGDMFVDSPAYKEFIAGGQKLSSPLVAEMEGKSIYNLAAGTATVQSLGTPEHLGITEKALRKQHVRDLFPKSSTGAPILYGIRETGWVNRAGFVKQRNADNTGWQAAAESELNLETVMYPVGEIAHFTRAHKNVLADEPRLKNFINGRMIDGVKYAEDHELLFGTGGAEKVTGITNVPGVQTYTGAAAEKSSIQIRRAITKALLAEYDPTGLVVSPQSWEELEIETDDTGAFRIAVAVAVGAEKRIWRLNVVETTAMNDTNFLLGSFGLGAELHDRESVKVEVSTEHGNNFVEGVVSVKAASRVALEVSRPESFVYGTFGTTVTP